jgi:hypothetical protein
MFFGILRCILVLKNFIMGAVRSSLLLRGRRVASPLDYKKMLLVDKKGKTHSADNLPDKSRIFHHKSWNVGARKNSSYFWKSVK